MQLTRIGSPFVIAGMAEISARHPDVVGFEATLAAPLPPQRYDVRGIPMVAKPVAGGFDIRISKALVADKDLEPMLVDLAKLVMKYQQKKP